MYKRLVLQIPEITSVLSYEEFCRIDKAYRREYVEYELWKRAVLAELQSRNPPELRNACGRVRVFLGTPDEFEREGLNFPIQSTAADVINMALVRMWKWLKRRKDVLPVAQVHDSGVFEVREEAAKELVEKAKRMLEAPVTVNGKKWSFPVDVGVGESWGELEEYEAE